MRQWIAGHERLALLIAFLVVTAVAVIGWGSMEFHNEMERAVYVDEFLGYVDDNTYSGTVTITAEQMPEWCQELGITGEQTIEFADGISGQIGMFGDVIYYENRYEKRTWFSGRIIEQASEFYYRLNSPIHLEPIYQPLECQIDVNNIKGGDYDYSAFKGQTEAAQNNRSEMEKENELPNQLNPVNHKTNSME